MWIGLWKPSRVHVSSGLRDIPSTSSFSAPEYPIEVRNWSVRDEVFCASSPWQDTSIVRRASASW
jgi:hypothetical protein